MKILLISPVYQVDKPSQELLTLPALSLHIIASLTPPEHEVKIIEEEVKLTDTNEDCDLVGISCYTANIRRCYQLADKFRARGIPVVLGGIHPTVMPDEAAQHADSVVIGEAEKTWDILLEDLKRGKLKKVYHDPYPNLNNFIELKTRKPRLSHGFGVLPAETSRGCPYTCDFCAVPVHYGRKQRHRPVEHVIRDLAESGGKRFFFVDDNIMGDPRYARELITQMIPLNIKWAGQSSIKVIQKNPDLLDLAYRSGCAGLFFGLETISHSSLKTLGKSIRDVNEIAETIRMIRDSGIYFYSGMIFGFDSDTESVFDDTLEFIQKNKIGSIGINILTPYPGTPLFAKLQAEGRIISTNWDDYNFIWGRVVYQPKNFTPEKLFEETLRIKMETASFGKTIERMHWRHGFYHMAINYGMYREARLIQKHHMKRTAEAGTNPIPNEFIMNLE